jgi:hypothetical protein
MAHQALVDAHVQVDARISVSEGHRIAEAVRDSVLKSHPEVLDVLVHIDPEEEGSEARGAGMPPRAELLELLEPLLGDLPPPEKIVLHYLGGQVEVEVFYEQTAFAEAAPLREAEGLLAERLRGHPVFRTISLHGRTHKIGA